MAIWRRIFAASHSMVEWTTIVKEIIRGKVIERSSDDAGNRSLSIFGNNFNKFETKKTNGIWFHRILLLFYIYQRLSDRLDHINKSF
jgi:hypothetical protein